MAAADCRSNVAAPRRAKAAGWSASRMSSSGGPASLVRQNAATLGAGVVVHHLAMKAVRVAKA